MRLAITLRDGTMVDCRATKQEASFLLASLVASIHVVEKQATGPSSTILEVIAKAAKGKKP